MLPLLSHTTQQAVMAETAHALQALGMRTYCVDLIQMIGPDDPWVANWLAKGLDEDLFGTFGGCLLYDLLQSEATAQAQILPQIGPEQDAHIAREIEEILEIEALPGFQTLCMQYYQNILDEDPLLGQALEGIPCAEEKLFDFITVTGLLYAILKKQAQIDFLKNCLEIP